MAGGRMGPGTRETPERRNIDLNHERPNWKDPTRRVDPYYGWTGGTQDVEGNPKSLERSYRICGGHHPERPVDPKCLFRASRA